MPASRKHASSHGALTFKAAILAFAVSLSSSVIASASTASAGVLGVAPEAVERGPFAVRNAQYKTNPFLDRRVLPNAQIELWAKAWWPENLRDRPRPIVFMLHGNHGTCGTNSTPRNDSNCQYTTQGSCPSGHQVVQSHLGYEYLATHLASHGYVVVSINANRGITCGENDEADLGLILARARLVIRHIQLWRSWTISGGAPRAFGDPNLFRGAIDLGQTGLFGHSRGGEGMRAVVSLLAEADSPWARNVPELRIRAVFEIGSSDFAGNSISEALNVPWTQILPLCDGDVRDLGGRGAYERMMLSGRETRPSMKALYSVVGANHNFFNSEWQENDAKNCDAREALFASGDIGSERQRLVALSSAASFFRAHVGRNANAALARHFDPLYALPPSVSSIAKVDRDFTHTIDEMLSARLEDFNRPAGRNSNGAMNEAAGVQIYHHHNDLPKRAVVAWNTAGSNVFMQLNWREPGRGVSIRPFATLDFRVARNKSLLNVDPTTDFSVRLVHDDGTLSEPVLASNFARLRGPYDDSLYFTTVRIPLSRFGKARLERIRGVRLTFDQSSRGSLLLAHFRFSSILSFDGPTRTGDASPLLHLASWNFPRSEMTRGAFFDDTESETPPSRRLLIAGPKLETRKARLVSRQFIAVSRQIGGKGAFEVTVGADKPFPVDERQPELQIGDKTYSLSRFPDDGRTDHLIFSIPATDVSVLESGLPSKVVFGSKNKLVYEIDHSLTRHF